MAAAPEKEERPARKALSALDVLTLSNLRGVGPLTVLSAEQMLSADGCTSPNHVDLLCAVQKTGPECGAALELSDITAARDLARRQLERGRAQGIGLLAFGDPRFPAALLDTVNEFGRSDPPVLLWYSGDLAALKKPGVAVIGSRHPRIRSAKAAYLLGAALAGCGFDVISGLACGCDTLAHHGALRAQGTTCAILAGGIDPQSIFPKENRALADAIAAQGGVLLSEYAPGTAVNSYAFTERDRLQAGLCLACAVIQTGARGGTMHAARACMHQGKPVFALRGAFETFADEKGFSGNRLLLEEGAEPFYSGSDPRSLAARICELAGI